MRLARAAEQHELYDVLGVKPGVSRAELKAAYFAEAKRLHPDTNHADPAASAKFLRVQQAWETLSRLAS